MEMKESSTNSTFISKEISESKERTFRSRLDVDRLLFRSRILLKVKISVNCNQLSLKPLVGT